MTNLTEALEALAFKALDHAVDSTIPVGGDLVPFALVDRSGTIGLSRFVAGTLEEGHARSRESLQGAVGLTRAAIAWEGYLTLEGTKFDAIFVEAYEMGAPTGVMFAQRYKKTGLFRRKRSVFGNPALVDDSRPPLF